MAALAKNALILVSEFGCPHVFLTLTCNPKWPEIMSQLLDGQTAFDRPEVTAAVFKSRLDLMKMNIRNGKYFDGRELIYTFHVINISIVVCHMHIWWFAWMMPMTLMTPIGKTSFTLSADTL